MKKRVVVAGLLVLLISALIKAEKRDKKRLRTVPAIDLSRYSGLWYEIARLPNRFENKCAGDVTAQYTVLSESKLSVMNQCRHKNGQLTKAFGEARLASKEGHNSHLKVRFAPTFLSFVPFVWGDYQIIDLATDYSYAVIGEPGRKYLWILSRAPRMDGAVYQRLVE